MFRYLLAALVLLSFSSAPIWAAPKKNEITYFSCTVREPVKGRKTPVNVTVKFAVKGYNSWKNEGELQEYPGANPDVGAIFVSPTEVSGEYTMMSNLNGQGGDLRIEGTNLRLWGDGAGYQFTELVIWDADEESDQLEGYVRDYGPTYGDSETFKQFIKCQRSNKKL
jgi:hypothetical protein